MLHPIPYTYKSIGSTKRRRFRRTILKTSKDKMSNLCLVLRVTDYVFATKQYLKDNVFRWNNLHDLIRKADSIFKEMYDTSSKDSTSSDNEIKEADSLFADLQVLLDRMELGNVILTPDERERVGTVIESIILSKYVPDEHRKSIILEVGKLPGAPRAIDYSD